MTLLSRHSGGVKFALGLPSSKLPTFSAGRNPVQLFDMQLGFVRYAELFYSLDSGLRRNDEVLSLVEKK